jgi:predicted DNA binding protein
LNLDFETSIMAAAKTKKVSQATTKKTNSSAKRHGRGKNKQNYQTALNASANGSGPRDQEDAGQTQQMETANREGETVRTVADLDELTAIQGKCQF